MMEGGDDANHESTYEIINPHHETNIPTTEQTPPPATAAVPNIPPPSALPAFASLSGSTFAAPTPPPPIPTTAPPTHPAPPPKTPEATHSGNPFSIRAAPSQHHHAAGPLPPLPPAPNVMIPTPVAPTFSESGPAASPPHVFGGQQQQPGAGIEIPFDLSHGQTYAAASSEQSSTQQQGAGGGLLGWFRGAVHSSPLLSKVAETAKSSVDSVIATLDPQMKEYMNNRGVLDAVITLDRDEEIRGMKEGVSRVFPASNVRPFVVAAGLNVAAQSVGFANALNAAQQKIMYIRNSGYIDPTSVIIGGEGFIIESLPETWHYFDCLVLDDATRQLQVHAFTQPVQVPNDIIQVLKDQTQADYPYRDLGYAVSVSHVMTHLWSLGPLEWQERLVGISRSELLKNAALALAYAYRGKL